MPLTPMRSDVDSRSGDRVWTRLGSSVIRVSWALTALGAQQAAHLLEFRPGRAEDPGLDPKPLSTTPFDAVANVVEEQFGGVFRGVYRVGREWVEGFGKALR